MSSMFETFFPFTRAQLFQVRGVAREVAEPYDDTALERQANVYGEETFRRFLSREHRRAALSGRGCLLLLIGLHAELRRKGVRMSDTLTASVCGGLQECVREVDLIGWYRQGRILGVILPQGDQICLVDARTRISSRLGQKLDQTLSPSNAKLLRVRLVPLGNCERP